MLSSDQLFNNWQKKKFKRQRKLKISFLIIAVTFQWYKQLDLVKNQSCWKHFKQASKTAFYAKGKQQEKIKNSVTSINRNTWSILTRDLCWRIMLESHRRKLPTRTRMENWMHKRKWWSKTFIKTTDSTFQYSQMYVLKKHL